MDKGAWWATVHRVPKNQTQWAQHTQTREVSIVGYWELWGREGLFHCFQMFVPGSIHLPYNFSTLQRCKSNIHSVESTPQISGFDHFLASDMQYNTLL